MFYCNSCAFLTGYPETNSKSRGTCELCERPDQLCNDRTSKHLPEARAGSLTQIRALRAKELLAQGQSHADAAMQGQGNVNEPKG